ncbi:plasma membrane protein Pth11-like protein [Hypoxylon sp. FL0543]|nr:plasma membrane protein Pth11-like protein [Hypoxylon sp. FL0543]
MAVNQKYYQMPGHIIAASVALSLIDIIALILRIWTRKKQRQALKADDWLILPATLLTMGIGISLIYGVSQRALGYPTRMPVSFAGNPLELETEQITMVAKLQWAFDLMVPLALGCVKASFLFFYRRIFAVNKKSAINYLLIGLITLIFAWSASYVVAFIFQCRLDFFAIWGSAMDLITYCNGSMNLALSLCITDFIFDTIVILLPIPLIWRLNLSTMKKVAICAIFLLGAATVAASLARLIIMARIATVGFDAKEDEVFVITEYLYWGIVECGVSIFAACLPSLQFLFRGWSWDSFIQTTRSIFSRNYSKSQIFPVGKEEIYVNRECDVIYENNRNTP